MPLAVQSTDPAYFDNRLHFNYLENPVRNGTTRDYKDDGVVRITNTGTSAVQILDAEFDGPFKFANPAFFNSLTIAAGQTVEATVLFDRTLYTPPTTNVDATSTLFEGQLTLTTNDSATPTAVIDLAGFWQARAEDGQEPNINEIWEVFGFSNRIEGLTTIGGGGDSVMSDRDIYRKRDVTEILSPYWKIADGVTTARVTQIAALHGQHQSAMGIHAPGVLDFSAEGVELIRHEATDNQKVLPNTPQGTETSYATKTFTVADIPDDWFGENIFGLALDGSSTDPRLNERGPVFVSNVQQGATTKIFQAFDADGNVLENVYLGIMDYVGINYDFNDNMYIFEGIAPVGVLTGGLPLAVSGGVLADNLTGNAGSNKIDGLAGNDLLAGLGGNDRIDGGTGRDRMEGGAGHDTYWVDNARDIAAEQADSGTDTVRSLLNWTLGNHLEKLILTGSATRGNGNALDNTLTGNAADNIFGGKGGRDLLVGAFGNDRLYGDDDADHLIGGSGADLLSGGRGNDLLEGGRWKDRLTGGTGADDFAFASANDAGRAGDRDVITDFTRGVDDIDLSRIDADTGRSGNQGFDFIRGDGFSGTAGELRFANTILSGDTDGDGSADFDISVWSIGRMWESDILL